MAVMKLPTTTGMLLFLGAPLLLSAAVTEAQRSYIDQATGAKGVYTEAEDTYKVTFSRTDVKVIVEGRQMSPILGFSSRAAFTSSSHGGLMVMGDVVLLEDEVNPAAVKGVRAAASSPVPRFAGEAVSEKSAITAATLDTILGVKGETNSGMYKATIGRSAPMHGAKVGKRMGLNTWAAFAGTDDNALVDGDFAMTKDELQGVLKALRKAGINIVAIHNHMTHEDPQYVFPHY